MKLFVKALLIACLIEALFSTSFFAHVDREFGNVPLMLLHLPGTIAQYVIWGGYLPPFYPVILIVPNVFLLTFLVHMVLLWRSR